MVIFNEFLKTYKVRKHTGINVELISVYLSRCRASWAQENETNVEMRTAEMKCSRKNSKTHGLFDNKKNQDILTELKTTRSFAINHEL